MRSRALRACMAALLCAWCTTAAALNDLDTIRARGMLVASVKNSGSERRDAHKDPAHFEKRGLEVGLARAIATRVLGSPDKLELRMMRKPERLPAVADGTVDLAISMLRITTPPAPGVEFSRPYYASGIAVLERADGNTAKPADLAGRTLVVIERHDIDPVSLVTELVPPPAQAPKVVTVADFDAGVAAIERGEASALLSEAVNIDVFLADHASGWRRSPLLREDRFGVAVAKGNQALLDAVNAVIDELERSGELAALARRVGLPADNP